MIDKSALQHLEDRTLQAQAVEGTAIPIRLLPKDVAVQSLESFLKHRVSYRGQFETQSIVDFARYASTFTGGSCFVDQEKMSALQIFDLGLIETPGHGEHRAKLALQRTAPYSALRKIEGSPLSQRDLAEWVEDWRDFIIVYLADGTPIDLPRAVASIRRITIAAKKEVTSSQETFKGARTALEEIEAKSEDEMFAGFRFACTPYHGLNERSFEMRMSILTGGEVPKLVLRLVRIEEAEEQMAKEFADLLSTSLKSAGGEANIYLGTYAVGK